MGEAIPSLDQELLRVTQKGCQDHSGSAYFHSYTPGLAPWCFASTQSSMEELLSLFRALWEPAGPEEQGLKVYISMR